MAQRTDQGAISDALKNFDSLPNSANVRQPVVEALFACSPATVWRMVKRGVLKPKKLSERVTAFNVGDLRKTLAA
jgi:predicted DNA-binding transcriptional regulator AlpA